MILQIKTKTPKFLNLKQNFTSSDSDSRIVSGGLRWWQKIWEAPLRWYWWQKIWVAPFSLSLSLYFSLFSLDLSLLSPCNNLCLFVFCFFQNRLISFYTKRAPNSIFMQWNIIDYRLSLNVTKQCNVSFFNLNVSEF